MYRLRAGPRPLRSGGRRTAGRRKFRWRRRTQPPGGRRYRRAGGPTGPRYPSLAISSNRATANRSRNPAREPRRQPSSGDFSQTKRSFTNGTPLPDGCAAHNADQNRSIRKQGRGRALARMRNRSRIRARWRRVFAPRFPPPRLAGCTRSQSRSRLDSATASQTPMSPCLR